MCQTWSHYLTDTQQDMVLLPKGDFLTDLPSNRPSINKLHAFFICAVAITAYIESNWRLKSFPPSSKTNALSYFSTTKRVVLLTLLAAITCFRLRCSIITYTITKELHPIVLLEDTCHDYTETWETFLQHSTWSFSSKHLRPSCFLLEPSLKLSVFS